MNDSALVVVGRCVYPFVELCVYKVKNLDPCVGTTPWLGLCAMLGQ